METSVNFRSPRPALDAFPNILIFRILQIGLAGCFIGHGAFGIITKAGWVPYFAVVGLDPKTAWTLMPWIGLMDITMGLLVLLRPCRALLFWAVIWTVWTALLRPLSGESSWEFLERAGNYGVPLAWLAMIGFTGGWLTPLKFTSPQLIESRRQAVSKIMQVGVVMLLCGHAGYGLILQKSGLSHHYAALHLPYPTDWVRIIGVFEFALAAVVLLRPNSNLLTAVALWKLGSEALYPLSGSPVWELIERFGSYALPLAYASLLQSHPQTAQQTQLSVTSSTKSSSC